jgi:hypothetical protein
VDRAVTPQVRVAAAMAADRAATLRAVDKVDRAAAETASQT